MKFLITTEADDNSAILGRLALEAEGHHVRSVYTADQPIYQKNSVVIDNNSYQWKSTDREGSITDNDYHVVWWRRPRKPVLTRHQCHPADYHFITRENYLFFESITDNLAPSACWINPKTAAKAANSKMLQLKEAKKCGLNIPITLCSNNPEDIRYFLLKYESDGVIYKPLCSNFWFEDEQLKIAYTAKIKFLDLPGNEVLQLTPGIYQKEIKKKYELRITCFGNYLVATKLNSQAHIQGKVDWRAIPAGELQLEPYVLPAELEAKIRAFMGKMGLIFGCLDFIVTEDNSYVFLEVNEQGQFLWIEDCEPEIKMLDILIQFLLAPHKQFEWNKRLQRHSISMYREKSAEILKFNVKNHVNLNTAEAYKLRAIS